MLNKNQLKSAVKNYAAQAQTEEDIRALLVTDEYSAEEIEQVIAEVFKNEVTETTEVKKGPNEALDLTKFDYKNLTGKKFKEYVELVGDRSLIQIDEETGAESHVPGSLKQDDSYDFELYPVEVVMKQRFPGVQGSPSDFNGVKIKNATPEHTTRIPIRHALEYNAQILNAHSRAGHGKYYLLKK
jgi:predicted transcriptional regulator